MGSPNSPPSGERSPLRAIVDVVCTRTSAIVIGTSVLIGMALYSCSPEQNDEPDKQKQKIGREKIDIPLFDELVKKLEQEFPGAIVETKKVGPETVVILLDRHVKEIFDVNMRRLNVLERYGAKRVGIEGSIDGGPQDRRVNEENDPILMPERKGPRPEGPLPARSYKRLYQDTRFVVKGLESPEGAKHLPLAVAAEDIIDQLLDAVRQGIPVHDPLIQRYLRIQEGMRNDPLFPRLNVSNVRVANLVGPQDMQLIGKLAVDFTAWRNENVATRNTIAADRMREFVPAGKNLSAIIMGRLHGSRKFEEHGKLSLQQELINRGMSVIVIDCNK